MSDKAPELEKYTPTRLDWLTVMLNAQFSYDNLSCHLFANALVGGVSNPDFTE